MFALCSPLYPRRIQGIARAMQPFFEELDYCPTPIGPVSLRHRLELTLKREVYEIKLGDEFLMSSLFTASEEALAHLGVDALEGEGLDVVVGGLGLGYTARSVLQHATVGSLIVVEMLVPVIAWHRNGLLPLGAGLVADSRCRFVEGDFFELAASEQGYDPATPGRRFDAILLDIDHSPEALLDERSTSFYQTDGLRAMAVHLKPGGIFGLWSNDPPDPVFTERLAGVFAEAWAESVTFDNPLQGKPFTQSVYLARR
jgi:spermidine synthase